VHKSCNEGGNSRNTTWPVFHIELLYITGEHVKRCPALSWPHETALIEAGIDVALDFRGRLTLGQKFTTRNMTGTIRLCAFDVPASRPQRVVSGLRPSRLTNR